MPVSNTYIEPQDGWQALVTGPAYIRISSVPYTHPFYVYKGSTTPGINTGGLISEGPYIEDIENTDTFYVRVVTPMSDGPTRIDTFWINGLTPPSDSSMFLEDGSSFFLLEDGSSQLLLES